VCGELCDDQLHEVEPAASEGSPGGEGVQRGGHGVPFEADQSSDEELETL
jgi:hypothetical protein